MTKLDFNRLVNQMQQDEQNTINGKGEEYW